MLAVAASAALLWATHSAAALGVLAAVALVPFLLALRGLPPLAAAFAGLALGLGFGLGALAWIPAALAHFGSPGPTPWIGLLLGVLCLLGPPYAALGAAVGALRGRSPAARILSIGLAFAAIDAARSHGLLGWPWLLLGHSQAHVPGMAQLAVLGGVPLLSGLLAALNAALAESLVLSWAGRRVAASPLTLPLLGALAAAALAGLPLARAFHPPAGSPGDGALRLLVVQPNIPVEERWAPPVQRTHLAIGLRLTQHGLAASPERPDLVVWPETFLTTALDRDDDLREELLRTVAELPAPLVLGAVRSATPDRPGRYRGSALWVDPASGIRAAVDKTQGVPMVETASEFPGAGVIRALIGQPAAELRLEEAPDSRALREGDLSLAVLFCFEVAYPGLAASRRDSNSALLLNLANDSWLATPVLSRQQLAIGAFRAIEARLPLVRVAHGGISAAIDPLGRTVQEIPFDTAGTAMVTLARGRPPSAAERAAFAGLLGAGALAGALAQRLLGRTR
jgi:apolipoprotein N-acyltransferase